MPNAAPKLHPAPPKGSQVPGIYPVYETGGRWLLLDRGRRSLLQTGSPLVVIGAKGAGFFETAQSSTTWSAACDGAHPVATHGYLLTARNRREFSRVGVPVIAILLRDKQVDLKKASFRALKNEASEDVYKRLDPALREAIVEDLRSGAFQIKVEDDDGQKVAKNPAPKDIQYKIDFGSPVALLDSPDAFLAVEGAQVSQTYRRCLRIYSGDRPLGPCAEMPHTLMTETRELSFLSYDPSRRGLPFVFAFTRKEPLWGHERWGFQLTSKGPRLFLHDAMDPRCREGF
ncbi:MAG TPA: hypothetical protein VNI01_04840, partial [Elusimicrobiota bacterium]|nr:hypothetical protein [Elusimicrobiota bacterium]